VDAGKNKERKELTTLEQLQLVHKMSDHWSKNPHSYHAPDTKVAQYGHCDYGPLRQAAG